MPGATINQRAKHTDKIVTGGLVLIEGAEKLLWEVTFRIKIWVIITSQEPKEIQEAAAFEIQLESWEGLVCTGL